MPSSAPATPERRVRRVITTRTGGVSQGPYAGFNLGDHVGDEPAAVEANRQRLAEVLEVPRDHFVYMEQLHTPNVTVVTGPVDAPVEATDAVVTTRSGLALVVLTADCVPVLLGDDEAGVIAAAHAGRLGASTGILPRVIETMIAQGARADRIHALLGPAAAGTSYEVPEAMAASVEQRLPGSRTRTSRGTPGLDLRAGLARQLEELGIGGVTIDPRDTVTDLSFFSYRREKTTGRQASVIWRP